MYSVSIAFTKKEVESNIPVRKINEHYLFIKYALDGRFNKEIYDLFRRKWRENSGRVLVTINVDQPEFNLDEGIKETLLGLDRNRQKNLTKAKEKRIQKQDDQNAGQWLQSNRHENHEAVVTSTSPAIVPNGEEIENVTHVEGPAGRTNDLDISRIFAEQSLQINTQEYEKMIGNAQNNLSSGSKKVKFFNGLKIYSINAETDGFLWSQKL